MATYNLFGSATPGADDSGDGSAYELGVVFRSYLAGNVTGVRFYKSTSNTGTHIGHLWTIGGTLLGSVTFTGESSSGWQTMNFASPIAITANTLYVISYSCPNGHYAIDGTTFYNKGVNSGPLRAVASQETSGNGIFNTTPGSFPNSTNNDANYWVDVIFENTDSEPSFSVFDSLWTGSDTPASVDSGDGTDYAMGVKFEADADGFVTGVKFYKASANTGTHIGRLWTNSGIELARVTFTGETTSGWQSMDFSPPIPVIANTTYVIACGFPAGHYSVDGAYFAAAGRTSGHLYAFRSNEVSPGNGVYIFNASDAFPSTMNNDANYWVDVIYSIPDSGTQYDISLSGTVTSAGAAVKQTATSKTGTLTSSGTVLKQIGHLLSGVLTSAGTATKQVGKVLVGSLTGAGNLVRAISRSLNGSLTPSGDMAKQTNRSVGGSLTSAGAPVFMTQKVVAGVLSAAGSIVRSTQVALSGGLASAGSVSKQIARSLAGTLTSSGAASAVRALFLNLSGELGLSGEVTRQISKTVSGSLAAVGSLTRRTAKTVSGVLTGIGVMLSSWLGVQELINLTEGDRVVYQLTIADQTLFKAQIKDE